MRFTESKKRKPIIILTAIIIISIASILSLCEFQPAQKLVQKTVIFEAD